MYVWYEVQGVPRVTKHDSCKTIWKSSLLIKFIWDIQFIKSSTFFHACDS